MVLAVRRSGASFTGPYNLRSCVFDDFLTRRDTWRKRVAVLQETIAEELYACVPQQESKSARAVILKAKRNIYNGRPVSASVVPLVRDSVREMISEYNSLIDLIADLLSSTRVSILEEFRSGLRNLAQESRFRLAVDYACPWLIEAYERHPALVGGEFTNEERGLFSYGVKFFSKANPLHLFAAIWLPREDGEIAEDVCEVIVDTNFALKLERSILAGVGDRYKRLVSLRTYLDDGTAWRFLTFKDGKAVLLSLKSSSLLSKLASFLSTSLVPRSLGECEDTLVAQSGGSGRSEIRGYLEGLIRHDILVEYLVSDFRTFPEQLCGADSDVFAPSLAILSHIHLRPVKEACLPVVESSLRNLDVPDIGTPTYYINRYCGEIAMPERRHVERITGDLAKLKPILAAMPNTGNRTLSLGRLLTHKLNSYPTQQAPYLRILYDCLRHWEDRSLNANDQEESALNLNISEDWLQELGELEGTITFAQLQDFVPPKSEGVRSICCNGLIDYRSGKFFVSNIFSGEGRFVSRYMLSKSGSSDQLLGAKDDVETVDVQLTPPLADTRLFVRALYPVGCGFENRYRYQFREWIDPSEILVELRDGRIRYRHAPTQKPLRIHYVGFLLSHYLGPEYGLLLLDHADSFANPFTARPKAHELGTALGPILRAPALNFESLCLRREEFRIPASAVQDALAGADLLEVAAQFRDSLHLITGTTEENWYFRTPRTSKGGIKPRYVDLRNPLSVQVLKREISSLAEGSEVSFSRMDPPLDAMPLENNHRYTTEFMIEV